MRGASGGGWSRSPEPPPSVSPGPLPGVPGVPAPGAVGVSGASAPGPVGVAGVPGGAGVPAGGGGGRLARYPGESSHPQGGGVPDHQTGETAVGSVPARNTSVTTGDEGLGRRPSSAETCTQLIPRGTGNSRGGTSWRAELMKAAQTGAAMAPPVDHREVLPSSYPTHTAARRSGVYPTNQASRSSSVVPVLPAAGRLMTAPTRPAVPPGESTLRRRSVTIYATRSSMTFSRGGGVRPGLRSTRPRESSTRRMQEGVTR